ncbi:MULTISPECIES: ABC transporter permease [Microbacterium]|uniref:ABC transporter permease n=1 Tax=Microbacterium TaxID=33882 RepID=UPI00278378CE|nr:MULTISPECIES: ABC transporter permease [Microbacterium]MDQ1085356.1 ribose transport system permease protein [Microbacterium sp. SORGH_AS_0344]MDQ1169339.1 ribose transport system permease protein [Microbacterium proteolyticum]
MTTPTSTPVTTEALASAMSRSRFSLGAFKIFAIKNAMMLVMVLVIVYFTLASPLFATLDNVQNILLAAAPFALIAFGQTLVILTGGIDLSVGSTIALSAMIAAWWARANPEQIWIGFAVAVASGILVGLINGALVAFLRVPAFIATLAMLTLASGLAYVIGDGAPINGLPAAYGDIAKFKVLGLQFPVIVMIVGFIVLAVVMRKTVYGTRIYATGGNPQASRIAGIKVSAVLLSVYVISGGLAAASGVLLSSRVIAGTPSLGQGYELDAIAAVVIGGASLMGGRGTVWGTLIGLLLIQTLNNGMDLLLVPSYWQSVIKGVLIAAAVAADVYVSRRTH